MSVAYLWLEAGEASLSGAERVLLSSFGAVSGGVGVVSHYLCGNPVFVKCTREFLKGCDSVWGKAINPVLMMCSRGILMSVCELLGWNGMLSSCSLVELLEKSAVI